MAHPSTSLTEGRIWDRPPATSAGGASRRARASARAAASDRALSSGSSPSGAISTSSAARVVPPGLVTFSRSRAAGSVGEPRQLAGAGDGRARQAHRQRPPAARPRRRPWPGIRSAGRHRPGRCRRRRSPRRSAPRPRPSRPRRPRPSRRSQSARCAGGDRGLAQATVMPRPIAAGVFGMARTTAASAPRCAGEISRASCRRRSTGTTRAGRGEAAIVRQHLAHRSAA